VDTHFLPACATGAGGDHQALGSTSPRSQRATGGLTIRLLFV